MTRPRSVVSLEMPSFFLPTVLAARKKMDALQIMTDPSLYYSMPPTSLIEFPGSYTMSPLDAAFPVCLFSLSNHACLLSLFAWEYYKLDISLRSEQSHYST
jgi:hypothetical protein